MARKPCGSIRARMSGAHARVRRMMSAYSAAAIGTQATSSTNNSRSISMASPSVSDRTHGAGVVETHAATQPEAIAHRAGDVHAVGALRHADRSAEAPESAGHQDRGADTGGGLEVALEQHPLGTERNPAAGKDTHQQHAVERAGRRVQCDGPATAEHRAETHRTEQAADARVLEPVEPAQPPAP